MEWKLFMIRCVTAPLTEEKRIIMKKKVVRIAAATLCMSMAMSAGAYAAVPYSYTWNYSGWNFTNWKNWTIPGYKNPVVNVPAPEEKTQPAVNVPELLTCKYIHQTIAARDTLRIDWEPVEEAETYEVLIAKDENDKKVYLGKGDGFSVPVGYDDFVTACMRGCTVKIRAVAPDGTYSEWSTTRKIGCNSFRG